MLSLTKNETSSVSLPYNKKNNFVLLNQDRIHIGVKVYTKAKDKTSESSYIFHIEEEKGKKKRNNVYWLFNVLMSIGLSMLAQPENVMTPGKDW